MSIYMKNYSELLLYTGIILKRAKPATVILTDHEVLPEFNKGSIHIQPMPAGTCIV